jgi:hypothetical protein
MPGGVGDLFLKWTGSQDIGVLPAKPLLPLLEIENQYIPSYLEWIHDKDFCNTK